MQNLPIGTVTFLFTEFAESSKLWEQNEGAMAAAVLRHHALLREAAESREGVVFKTVAEGACAVFGSPSGALQAAVAAQRAFQVEPWPTVPPWPTPEPLQVRLALHTGFAEPQAGDYFGPPIHRAARLLGAAHGGQILLSLVTAELVRDQLPPDLTLRNLGLQRLRDLSRPEQIFQLVAPDLPADFPPLNTLDHHPHNLPLQPTTLIGREQEVTNVCALLNRDEIRLVTLTGPGGSGKTRLALHTAAELLEQFRHGVYFVPLASTSDPNLVAAAIAQVLSVRTIGKQVIVDTLKDYLSNQQLLLLLDNFEQVLEAALLVSELLTAAPRLKILVTSRSALRLSGEQKFAVPPLSLPDRAHLPPSDRLGTNDSVRLFIERTQAVQPDFAISEANAAAVVEICHRLDGLPLAIELAAARSKLFSPAALLERLSSPLAVLTGGQRDLPARQQTLHATIEWSYNLLPTLEQQLFKCLAVFSGGCTLDAIEATCGRNSYTKHVRSDVDVPPSIPVPQEGSVVDRVELLLDHNLLQQVEGVGHEPRLMMLETIRQYALDRLAVNGAERAVHQGHADYYLALAEKANLLLDGSEQGTWLARLEEERDNLRAALDWYQTADPERGLCLAVALWRFWEMHSHLSEGRAWLSELLQLSHGSSGSLRARALNGAGVLAHWQGDYGQATIFLQEGLALFHELHDHSGVARVLQALGLVAWFQGNHEVARSQLEESVAHFRAVNHRWGVADALHWLGHVVLDLGDATMAQALFEKSLRLFRETGDKRNIALPLKDFGLIASQKGDHKQARALYEESLALSRAVEDTWHIAETLQRLGDLARIQGDDERADRLGQESLELWRKMGNKGGIAETLSLLGDVAQLRSSYQQATSFYTDSLSLLRPLGSKRIIAGVLHNLGKVASPAMSRSGRPRSSWKVWR